MTSTNGKPLVVLLKAENYTGTSRAPIGGSNVSGGFPVLQPLKMADVSKTIAQYNHSKSSAASYM